MQPKVSILVPTYNVEPYLVQCMDSLVNQTLKEIEIIVVNDGSTDNSLEILKSYAEKDDRIILIDKENGGYGVGMNVATSHATGEYIGIVEPDDHVPLRMYEDLYNKVKEYDLDFVKADFYRFAKNENTGDVQYIHNHLSKDPEDYNVVFNPSEEPRRIKHIMNTWSGIYRRSFLEEYNIVYNETPGASFQDNGFFFQTFAFAKRAMILDTPYYLNRRDNPNSSVKDPGKVYAMNIEYDHIRKILVQHPETWEKFRGIFWYKKFYNGTFTLSRISDELKREYVERFAEEFAWAEQRGELDESVFTPLGWRNVQLLISNPQAFYDIRVVPDKGIQREYDLLAKECRKLRKQNAKLQKKNDKLEAKVGRALTKLKAAKATAKKNKNELVAVKKSTSYKVGRIITYIPRKFKQLIKKLFRG